MSTKYTSPFAFAALIATSAFASANLGLEVPILFTHLVDPGARVNYAYHVGNRGPDTADVRLIHPMPAGAHFLAVDNAAWSCSEGLDAVSCTRTLQANAAETLILTIAAPDDP